MKMSFCCYSLVVSLKIFLLLKPTSCHWKNRNVYRVWQGMPLISQNKAKNGGLGAESQEINH